MRHRLARHIAVVAAALLVPLVGPHVAAELAGAAADDGGGFGTAGVIEGIPAGATIPRGPARTVVAAAGQTVEGVAAAAHADAGTVRWANRLTDVTQPRPGSPLLVPPGPGAVLPARAGERPSEFAERHHLEPQVLLDYNRLESDAPLPAGWWLQVPRGAAPGGSLTADDVVPSPGGGPAVPSTQFGRASAGRFPYGQCTYYVWTRRYVPWNGDAWEWLGNARLFGRPTGRVPVPGSIVVMWGSWVGHVAYVEKVFADGTFLISEMNLLGPGVQDQRVVSTSSIDLIGFVY